MTLIGKLNPLTSSDALANPKIAPRMHRTVKGQLPASVYGAKNLCWIRATEQHRSIVNLGYARGPGSGHKS